jgi:uncharacterized membrane protein
MFRLATSRRPRCGRCRGLTIGLCAPWLLIAPRADAGKASFQGIGDLPGGDKFSRAVDVSADGRVVIGRSSGFTERQEEPVRWTWDGGIEAIGDLPGGAVGGYGFGVSPDGTHLLGWSYAELGRQGYVWTEETGMVGLPDIEGGEFWSFADAITADNGVIVGSGTYGDHLYTDYEACRWRWISNGEGSHWEIEELGFLPGGQKAQFSHVEYIYGDGSFAVGYSTSANTDEDDPETWNHEACVWRFDEDGWTIEALGDLDGGSFDSAAAAISADGKVIVGYGSSENGGEACRWTYDGEKWVMESLGRISDQQKGAIAYGVSPDGSVIVGSYFTNGPYRAFIWDAMHGMRNLKVAFEKDYGLDLKDWSPTYARGMSLDGFTIVGFANHRGTVEEGFVAELPMPGDMNCDDRVDFDDIDGFVAALISREGYEQGYPDCDYMLADVNADGSVDFNDIDPFVELLIE